MARTRSMTPRQNVCDVSESFCALWAQSVGLRRSFINLLSLSFFGRLCAKPGPRVKPARAKLGVDPTTQVTANAAAKRRCMVVSAIGARVRNSPQGGISSTHAKSLRWRRWCAPAPVRQPTVQRPHRHADRANAAYDRRRAPRRFSSNDLRH